MMGKPSSQVVPGTPGAIFGFPSPAACRAKDHDSHSPRKKKKQEMQRDEKRQKVVNRRQKGQKSQGECKRASGRWEG